LAQIYSDELSVREALEIYFMRSGFSSETYNSDWVKLPIGRFNFYMPNFSARKRAVPLHDIDHILTEYDTTWSGEFQISAYEIGTGCGSYWAAWFINLQGIVAGIFVCPLKTIRAFARGRRSPGIFANDSYEPLLEKKVGHLRRELTKSPESVRVSGSDLIYFSLWVSFSIAAHATPVIALAFAWA
jgi:hypothetical protein